MSLKFFTDQCVPRSVIRAFQDAGYEVYILGEHIPRDSDDAVVIAKAQELDTVFVSFNGDFADIATYPPSQYKGIITLQVRNHPESIPALMQRLFHYLSTHPEMCDYEGRLFLVEVHRIRIRK